MNISAASTVAQEMAEILAHLEWAMHIKDML